MRVALLSFDYIEYSLRLATALATEAEVLLCLPDKLESTQRQLIGDRVHFQPFHQPRLRQPLRQLGLMLDLRRWLRRFQPDVVHIQQGHLWLNLLWPLFRRYPLVITIHDPRYHSGDRLSQKTPQWVMDLGFHRADRLIVHGQHVKQMAVEQIRLPAERIHVMPMLAQGQTAQPPTESNDGESTVLFFGRIWEYKGLDYLIRAEPLITAQVPDVSIVIAGQGEDFARYRQLMRHPERFVVYNEYVSDEKRAELFRQARLVVLPYVDATQSAVIPVAYTFGKPVVATTVGSIPEMVEHERTGLLVAPRDEQALAQAIVRLWQDDALRHTLGRNARRKAEQDLAVADIARQTLNVYRLALADRTQ